MTYGATMLGARMLVLLDITVLFLAPARASFDMYEQTGQHCSQMQSWKISTNNYLNTLDNLITALQEDVVALNESLKASFDEIGTTASGLMTTAEDISTRLDLMAAGNDTALEPGPLVAFQAYMTTSGSSITALNTITIKYNDVELNLGNHFSTSTGLFTAPKTGLYWIHATFEASGSKQEAVLKMTKGGSSATSTKGYLNYFVNQETGASTVIRMEAGDTIGVYPKDSSFEQWDMGLGYANNFAGYLIAEYSNLNGDETTTTTTTTTTTAATTTNTTETTTTGTTSTTTIP